VERAGEGAPAPAHGWRSPGLIKLFPAPFWEPQGLGLPQRREGRSCADMCCDHPLRLRARKLFYLVINTGIAVVADSLA